MSLVRLAYYPFLPEVREMVRELGPDPKNLFSGGRYEPARKRAVDRVRGAMQERKFDPPQVMDDSGAMQELLSVGLARMLVVCLEERTATARYAEAEANLMLQNLAGDPGALPDILAALDIQADGDELWQLHFRTYIQHAPLRQAGWKLVQRPVRKGIVELSREDMELFAAEALKNRITSELAAEQKKGVPKDLRNALQLQLDVLAPILAEEREKWGQGELGPVQSEMFPPCMVDLYTYMAEGKMIPHHGRFAFASFMSQIGLDAQGIMDFFRGVPNFDPEKSRYQIEHIAGERSVEKYMTPGCGYMQSNGVCPLQKRDNLCLKIKNPLSYYRARKRFQEDDKKKADEMLAKQVAKRLALQGDGAAPGVIDAGGQGAGSQTATVDGTAGRAAADGGDGGEAVAGEVTAGKAAADQGNTEAKNE